jgi:hypothetical protein
MVVNGVLVAVYIIPMKNLRHSQLYSPLGLIEKHAAHFDTKSLHSGASRVFTTHVADF